MKYQLEPSDSSSFPPLHDDIAPSTLTVIQAFTFISYILMHENLFVCFEFYGPVNNEGMSNRSDNSGIGPGQP